MNKEIKKRKSFRKDVILASAGFFVSSVFVLSTNPKSLPVALLLVLPMLVLITSFYVSKVAIGLFTDVGTREASMLSGVLAAAPTLLVVFGSVGGLGLQDVALSVLLVLGMGWYLKRSHLNQSSASQP